MEASMLWKKKHKRPLNIWKCSKVTGNQRNSRYSHNHMSYYVYPTGKHLRGGVTMWNRRSRPPPGATTSGENVRIFLVFDRCIQTAPNLETSKNIPQFPWVSELKRAWPGSSDIIPQVTAGHLPGGWVLGTGRVVSSCLRALPAISPGGRLRWAHSWVASGLKVVRILTRNLKSFKSKCLS